MFDAGKTRMIGLP